MYDEDEAQPGAVIIPGFEAPYRYDQQVNLLACGILGHKPRVCSDHHAERLGRGKIYHWAYCNRCGEHLWGETPFVFEVDLSVSPPRANFRLEGLTDAMIEGRS